MGGYASETEPYDAMIASSLKGPSGKTSSSSLANLSPSRWETLTPKKVLASPAASCNTTTTVRDNQLHHRLAVMNREIKSKSAQTGR
eukprot:jgi/Botrbrau1/5398/Bobra.182_1s0002.1